MIDKLFSRKTPLLKHHRRLLGMGSRENAGIFLRSDTLRERSIARRIRRARIETWNRPGRARLDYSRLRSGMNPLLRTSKFPQAGADRPPAEQQDHAAHHRGTLESREIIHEIRKSRGQQPGQARMGPSREERRDEQEEGEIAQHACHPTPATDSFKRFGRTLRPDSHLRWLDAYSGVEVESGLVLIQVKKPFVRFCNLTWRADPDGAVVVHHGRGGPPR